MNNSSSTRSQPIRVKSKFRRIVFTINNYSEKEFCNVILWTPKWLIVARETGETGTPHLQGAAILGREMTLGQLKAIPGLGRAHIETMRGQPIDSLNYCTKEDRQAFQSGTIPRPGTRTDLTSIVNRVQAGQSLTDLAGDTDGAVAVVKYHRGLTALRSLCTPPRTSPPVVLWLYGATGVGKTASAIHFLESVLSIPYWITSTDLKWFDGYDGHEAVIFDDLRSSHSSFSFLLRILDRYRLSVPRKGGFLEWVPKLIIITCPYSPTRLWNLRTEEQLGQLTRRITGILEFDASIPYSESKPQHDLSEYYPGGERESGSPALLSSSVLSTSQETIDDVDTQLLGSN